MITYVNECDTFLYFTVTKKGYLLFVSLGTYLQMPSLVLQIFPWGSILKGSITSS